MKHDPNPPACADGLRATAEWLLVCSTRDSRQCQRICWSSDRQALRVTVAPSCILHQMTEGASA